MADMTDDVTLKALSAGKSAIQNEVMGELQGEFGEGPEGAPEMKLSELATKFPGYDSLGKVTSGQVNKMLSGKMPGGYSATKAKALALLLRLVQSNVPLRCQECKCQSPLALRCQLQLLLLPRQPRLRGPLGRSRCSRRLRRATYQL